MTLLHQEIQCLQRPHQTATLARLPGTCDYHVSVMHCFISEHIDLTLHSPTYKPVPFVCLTSNPNVPNPVSVYPFLPPDTPSGRPHTPTHALAYSQHTEHPHQMVTSSPIPLLDSIQPVESFHSHCFNCLCHNISMECV